MILHRPILTNFVKSDDLDPEISKLRDENYDLLLRTFNESVPLITILLFSYSKLIKILEANDTPFYLSYFLIQKSNYFTIQFIDKYCSNLREIAIDLIRLINIRAEWGGAELSRAIFSLTVKYKKESLNQFNFSIEDESDITCKNLYFDKSDFNFLDKVSDILQHKDLFIRNKPKQRVERTKKHSKNKIPSNQKVLHDFFSKATNKENEANNENLSDFEDNSDKKNDSDEEDLDEVDNSDNFNLNDIIGDSNSNKEINVQNNGGNNNENEANNENFSDIEDNSDKKSDSEEEDSNKEENSDKEDVSEKTNIVPFIFKKYCSQVEEEDDNDEDYEEEEEIIEQSKLPKQNDQTQSQEENENQNALNDQSVIVNNAKQLNEGIYEMYTDSNLQVFNDSSADKNWKILKLIAQNFKWDKEKIKKAHRGYIIWITTTLTALEIEDDLDDNTVWEYIKLRDEFKDIAELRDILISIPASEASCERIFSVLKKIINPSANRTGEELEMGRLTYLNF